MGIPSVLHENETEVREVEVQMDESGQPEFRPKAPTRPLKMIPFGQYLMKGL